MVSARLIEHRITRNLLRDRELRSPVHRHRTAERLITAVAVCASMLVLGSVAPELLWALVAAAAVLTLGTRLA